MGLSLMHRAVLSLTAVLAIAGTAAADIMDEVRFGVMQENICVTDCNNANKESGQSLTGELLFKSPDFLDVLWSPRPYVMGSLNLRGDTSFGGAGLHWSFPFTERLAFEPSVGYVIHDGVLESPFPQGDPRGDTFTQKHVLLGSRDLFRTTFGLKYAVDETWGVEVLYEHLSHGQILGNGRNQGLDNIGVRVSYALGN